MYTLGPGNAFPLYLFNGSNRSGGYYPYGASLSMLLATCLAPPSAVANASGQGLVFELKRPAQPGTPWTESILHDLSGSGRWGPDTPLLLKNPVLYGTTLRGGNQGCQCAGGVGCGTVFQVVP